MGPDAKMVAVEHAELEGYGYSYLGIDHIEMCKFHVDDMTDHLVTIFPLEMSVRFPITICP